MESIMIYLDHNAAAPYSPSVREYLENGLLEDWENPSAVYPKAQILERRIRECKRFAAERLNCSPKQLFWTGGGTESINTVLSLETLALNHLSGFITSPLEHHASLNKIEFLYRTCRNSPRLVKKEDFESLNPSGVSQTPGFNTPPLRRRASLNKPERLSQISSSSDFSLKRLSQTPGGGFLQHSKSNRRPPKKLFFQEAKNGEGIQRPERHLKVLYAGHNDQGEIDLNDLDKICAGSGGSLLSFLSANNETGVISDIKAISKIAKKYDCLLHVDAVQSLGKEALDLEDLDVDFASFSGHKIGAMKGVGLLYAKKPFAPLMFGGGQERGLRSGTYNFPSIYSFKLALQDIDLSGQKKVRRLRDYFENQLKLFGGEIPKNLAGKKSEDKEAHFFKVNGGKAPRLSNTSNIYCGEGVSNQEVLFYLAKKGICASMGSACNTGSPEPSHVIRSIAGAAFRSKEEAAKKPSNTAKGDAAASNRAADYARSCIRLSFAPSNTKEEVDFLIQALKGFYSPRLLSHPPSLHPA